MVAEDLESGRNKTWLADSLPSCPHITVPLTFTTQEATLKASSVSQMTHVWNLPKCPK